MPRKIEYEEARAEFMILLEKEGATEHYFEALEEPEPEYSDYKFCVKENWTGDGDDILWREFTFSKHNKGHRYWENIGYKWRDHFRQMKSQPLPKSVSDKVMDPDTFTIKKGSYLWAIKMMKEGHKVNSDIDGEGTTTPTKMVQFMMNPIRKE